MISQHENEKSKTQYEDILKRNSKEKNLSKNNLDSSRYGTDYIVHWNDVPLTVSNIFLMSLDDKKKVAQYLFNYFREGGFPYPKYPDEDLKKDWDKLKKYEVSSLIQDDIISCGATTGNKIFKHFSPQFYDVKESGSKSRSPIEVFDNDILLMKVIENRLGITFYYRGVSHPFTITGNMFRQGIRSMRLAPQTSNFRPTVAKLIYEKYAPENGKIFDYSSGFNQRLLGAMASSKNLTYVGVDPWGTTIDQGNKLIKHFGFEDRAKLHNMGSEDFCPEDLIESFDLAFSSPPYHEKEKYTDEASQAYSQGYESFLNDYWTRTVQNVGRLLKPSGRFVLNISDKHKELEIKKDMVSIIESNGFHLSETLFMKFSKSHLSKKVGTENLTKLEPILVFEKTLLGE